jgi:DUF4097 and DUF4098 domain-containing protein YvlB
VTPVRYLLSFGLLLVALVPVGQAMDRTEQKSFTLPTNGSVKIDTYRGKINVVPGPGSEVKISVHSLSEKKNDEAARRALDELQLDMRRKGSSIVVTARNPRETGVRFIWQDQAMLDLEFDVTVPATCNLDLRTGDGGITVGNLTGTMRARTDTGTIFFRQIDGSVDARANSGDIVVSRCSGPVTLKTVRGDVQIGTVGGQAVLETVNGDIEVQTARAQIVAKAADGNITAGFATITGESSIRTAVGNITATVNPEEASSIHATSLWGKIFSKLPVQAVSGGNGHSKLVGRYNGGGPLIELDASGGYVKIKPGEPLFDY